MWKRVLNIVLWSVLGVSTCTLLIAAMHKKDETTCSDIEIEINGAHDHVFVDRKDVLAIMQKNGAKKGEEISQINLRGTEDHLERNAWVKKAELFFDNNQVLHAIIEEREPLARIFTLQGNSYYIDSSCRRLPLSDELSARVPMFTSFPSDKKVLSRPDSLVLQDVKQLAQYIQRDSFLMAQVAQVDITSQRTYEITPVLGNQLIKIGDAEDLDEKFARLKSFYKQVWAKTGFEKYEVIDVQYHDQVVATKRGSAKMYMDTAKAMQQFANTMNEMKSVMNDTVFAAAVPKAAVQKDSAKINSVKTNEKKPVTANKKPAATSKKIIKPAADKKKPKAVLKKN